MNWIPRPTVRLRTFHIAALFALVVVVGFGIGNIGAGILILPDRETDRSAGPDAYAWDGTPPRIPITAPDPGGHERWALQVYRSKAGTPCLRVGRLHHNGDGIVDFGQVYAGRSFHSVGIEDNGSPVDLSKGPHALLVNHYVKTSMVAIFGIVRREVKTVTLHLATETSTLPIRGGAYLAVLPDDDFSGGEVRFTFRDGTSETVRLRSPPGVGRAVGDDEVAPLLARRADGSRSRP